MASKLKTIYFKIRMAIILMRAKYFLIRRDKRTKQVYYGAYVKAAQKIYWTPNYKRATAFTFRQTAKLMNLAQSTNKSPVYEFDFKACNDVIQNEGREKK